MKYYKITNEKEYHNDLKYNDGWNEDPLPFNPSGDCEPGGIYFSDEENILYFLDYGSWLREVTPEEPIYENPSTPKKWKAHKVFLGPRVRINDSVVMKLVEKNKCYIGENVLEKAVHLGFIKTVKLLLEEGVDPYSLYAFRIAAKYGHVDILKLFLEKGVDPNSYDAFYEAASYGCIDVVKFLLEKGVDPNSQSAFYGAACCGRTNVVKLLLENGVDPDSQDAFEEAVHYGYIETAEIIKNWGTDT